MRREAPGSPARLPPKKLDTRGWVTPQWLYFLDGMPATLRRDQLAELDQAFGFTRSANAEIAGELVRAGDQAATISRAIARLEEYLKTNGRAKLIVPLYAELMKTPAGDSLAKRVYALARPVYQPHTVAASMPSSTPAAESADDE